MDKDVAREVIRSAFRSGSELEKLLGVLKKQCAPEDYKLYARQVATAIDSIHTALTDKIVARFPELQAEMESNLARTGRAMP